MHIGYFHLGSLSPSLSLSHPFALSLLLFFSLTPLFPLSFRPFSVSECVEDALNSFIVRTFVFHPFLVECSFVWDCFSLNEEVGGDGSNEKEGEGRRGCCCHIQWSLAKSCEFC